jgi:heme exporter protein A
MMGEVILLTGNNGIGKSTLLKTLLGFIPALKGRIQINQNDLTNDPGSRQEHLNYLGHKNALQEAFTVFENLSYWHTFFPSNKTNVLEIMDFWCLPNIRLNSCSEGQKKRTALARLSLIGRCIWLLDEPSTNLDKEGKKKLVQTLENHRTNGGITIVSTHNPGFFNATKIIELSAFQAAERDENA